MTTNPPDAPALTSSSVAAPSVSSTAPTATQTISSADNATLGVPTEEPKASSSTGLSGATANDPTDSIGHRVSKRSLRRRGSAASSKRSHNAAAQMNEKNSRPVSAGGGQTTQPRAKKKSKFLSLLCCGSPDETEEAGQELTQAPRQANPGQPSQAPQQPATSKQLPVTPAEQNTEAATSVLDEKAASPAYAANETNTPVETKREKEPVADVSSNDKPVPALPSESSGLPPISSTVPAMFLPPGVGPSETATSEESRSEAPRLDTSVAADPSYLGNPDVVVQAPTPVAPESEDQLISDRTPEQEARDKDIEMTDVGPNLPLSSNDVSGTSEDESHVAPHNESQNRIDLPPPPPLEERHAQVVHEDTSVLPSPEQQKWLLPPIRPEFKGKKCLVLDLDETLVHSSFKVRISERGWIRDKDTDRLQILHQADFTIPVEIEGQYHNVYVIKRPGVDQFMKRVGELYEVVVFTASVSKVSTTLASFLLQHTNTVQYGDPLLDQLDIHGVVHHRLFRESCYNHQGNYVKVRKT